VARARAVLVTGNFDRNLAGIHEFLSQAGAVDEFDRLVHRLEASIIPQLQRFPESGAEFLDRAPVSVEGRGLFEDVAKSLGRDAQLRQLIDGDYIVLYLVEGGSVYLLSVKHHRQLSFDLPGHWP
jgi:hypothetical protein